MPGQDETAPLLPPLAGDVMETMTTYGEAKVACEQHVLDAYGADRTLIARAGLIGGPGDIFDRTAYWALRFSRPAARDVGVLVPDAPQEWTGIDVRDLAGWIVEAGSRGTHGIFNATGEMLPLAQHLQVARIVAGHTGALVAAAPDWLLAHHVQPWMVSARCRCGSPTRTGPGSTPGTAARRGRRAFTPGPCRRLSPTGWHGRSPGTLPAAPGRAVR